VEHYSLLTCDVVLLGKWCPTFEVTNKLCVRNVMHLHVAGDLNAVGNECRGRKKNLQNVHFDINFFILIIVSSTCFEHPRVL
jgi:hypothetical protein